MTTLSPAVEDYLKAIYEIQSEGDQDRVSTSALADCLGVARASVTGMLKKLNAMDPKLVNYIRYRGVQLTPAGEKIALEVLRHHRLIELYLSEALGYSWDEVHQEADNLEHVISEDLEDRIATLLGHPQVDPHGAPIPDRDGNISRREEVQLTQLGIHQPAHISRVSDHDPAMLRYLQELGLTLNAQIEVTEKAPFSGPLHIRLIGTEIVHALGRQVADYIFVTLGSTGRKKS
ncbi:MAG TPA: metal-dependent transcriptional regulator [Anaerolineae bacterium]|nr:metal-dependent transcriptional regulator [Anaerolineae bacterium]